MTAIQGQPETVRGYRDPQARRTPAVQPRVDEPGEPAEAPTAWRQRIPGPQLPGFVSGATLLTGLWLMLAPSVWDYGDTGGGFDASWNDLLVGLVVAGLGAARLAAAIRLGPATAISVVAGGWLIVAPFALAYGFGTDSTRATINDVLLGLLILAVAAIGHVNARAAVATRL